MCPLLIVPCGLGHVTNKNKKMNVEMEEVFASWVIEKTKNLKDTEQIPHP